MLSENKSSLEKFFYILFGSNQHIYIVQTPNNVALDKKQHVLIFAKHRGSEDTCLVLRKGG